MNNIKVRKAPCLHHRWLHWNGFWVTHIFAQKFHILMDCHDLTRTEKSRLSHEMCKRTVMGSLALAWEIQSAQRNQSATTVNSEPTHRTASKRLAISLITFPSSMENHLDHLAYQNQVEFQIRMPTCWKNVNYYCTNTGYGLISFADIEKQWSKFDSFQEK